ncbi:MAG: hypothetical protein WA133_01595 [Syntrophales bacterium]
MKLRNHSLTFFTMLLLGTVAFLGGCATTGMDRSVKTTNSIQEVDQDIRNMGNRLDRNYRLGGCDRYDGFDGRYGPGRQ